MEKILPSDLVNKGVIGLPDTPGLDTTQMQQKFDEIALDVIIPHYNDLVDELGDDFEGKADKVASATNGNFAGLDANGNLTDSGSKASDFMETDGTNAANHVAFPHSFTAGSRKEESAVGIFSTVVGYENEASGDASYAEGISTTANNTAAHAEGGNSIASGNTSHAEGLWTVSSGNASHAECNHTTASGGASHAEGYYTTASGEHSHAEGSATVASHNQAHAEGDTTTASGNQSHAEGYQTTASGTTTHAEGDNTIAAYECQHVQGKYNDNKSTTLFEIGNGTANNARNNAFEVYSDGSLSQDNGTTKFRFTEVSGQKGYYDENGTFNAFGSGGGGSSTLAGLQDVSISGTPSGGEILKYNSTSSKWENGTETAQVQADWNQATSTAVDYIKNKPTIPDAQIQSDWNQSDNTAKDFIKNKPTIPSAQVNSDWNAASGVAQILNKPTLATVATSGSYSDLSNKPTIPDEISELGDVSISSLTNGQILKYNSTSQKWENSAAGGGGDMQASTYDPNGTVATAGGIVAYIDDTITAALTASY